MSLNLARDKEVDPSCKLHKEEELTIILPAFIGRHLIPNHPSSSEVGYEGLLTLADTFNVFENKSI